MAVAVAVAAGVEITTKENWRKEEEELISSWWRERKGNNKRESFSKRA